MNTPVGKHDNYSLLRELTAYEYANRYHTMLRFSNLEDVTRDDIFASILGDLLEDLDSAYEDKWILNPDDYFDESVDIQNTVKQEQLNKNSEFVWNTLLNASSNRAKDKMNKELEEISADKENERIAAALMKSIGSKKYAEMSEQDRQAKILAMKRAERKLSKSSTAQKVLSDFDGDQVAYKAHLEEQRKAQKQAIEAKILALNKKQDSAEKTEELENLKILKRSLRKVFIRFFFSVETSSSAKFLSK